MEFQCRTTKCSFWNVFQGILLFLCACWILLGICLKQHSKNDPVPSHERRAQGPYKYFTMLWCENCMRFVWEMRPADARKPPSDFRLPASSFQLPVGRETVSVYVFLKEKQSIRFSEFLKPFIIIWKVFLLFCHVFSRVLWEMYFLSCLVDKTLDSVLLMDTLMKARVWEICFLYEKRLSS